MTNKNNNDELAYLFNVDILIKSKSNALALQSLIELLNQGKLVDYRIKSGVELGEIIEATLSAKRQAMISKASKNPGEDLTSKEPVREEVKKPAPKPSLEVADKLSSMVNMNEAAIQSWIQNYVANNKLVRLSIERNRERVTLPCRILNYAPDTRTINVYHVDEKQVYTFRLSEIIDFVDA
ncbi:hypothetical protein [Paenibacillus sp. J22TS3]|uniref:hypothetical protein n=1 Tax=Paenibacillus sp. J22TS3 TaxID=2807192 RepID=UPI001B1326B1|nr:hypothetical protein [Paenibacillus sp. J22TS3]GIP20896.1 hypothetical protein J22TS3_11710 [Paenibacillus sp. J22TS3]